MLKEGQCMKTVSSSSKSTKSTIFPSIDLKNDNFQKATDITQQGQRFLIVTHDHLCCGIFLSKVLERRWSWSRKMCNLIDYYRYE